MALCECGCGLEVKPGNRFINHHNTPIKKGSHHSESFCEAIRNGMRKEKDPLSPGQKIPIPENKNCPQYLGCIAEELLATTFKDVRRMPFGNHGFDIICDQDFKIDIKSSATGYQGDWLFLIRENKIADYFLCIAFENREDLNPVHLWLIPGHIINHLRGIRISKSTIEKWAKYEQPIDKVLICCNMMKEEG